MMGEVLAALGRLPPLGWVSVGLAVLGTSWLVRPPPDRLRRATGGGGVGAGRWASVLLGRGWAAGSPDGPGPARRLILAGAAGLGLCLTGSRLVAGLGSWVWLAWPVVTVVGAVLLGAVEPRAVRLRRERMVIDLPQALDLLAAGLAAGMPVRLATRAVAQAFDGPVAEDLARVLALADLGQPEADAWRSLAAHPQLGPAAADLARSVESGTFLVETLTRHAVAAREARRAALVVRARSVGVRSVLPLMTCFIPSFLLLGVVPTVVSTLQAALG